MNQKQKFSELLVELKSDYLKKLPDRIQELKKTGAEKNWNLLEELYHNLKGTGKTYGLPEVSIICEIMELQLMTEKSLNSDLAECAIQVLESILESYQQGRSFALKDLPNSAPILALKKKEKL